MISRSDYVDVMRSWVGGAYGSPTHKSIIDLYNTQKPLPVGARMSYTAAYCAATVTAAAVTLGITDEFPCECSCGRMIELAKKKNIWIENDAYIPKPADLIIYDWDDNGIGDNQHGHDHVGCVEKVIGDNITVIEGNRGNAHDIGRRIIKVNGRYIRGYVCQRYLEDEEVKDKLYEVKDYVVKPGDYVNKIIGMYDMTIEEFKALNPNVKNINLIYPGQTLKVRRLT